MKKQIALVLALATMTAGVTYSALRTTELSARLDRLERRSPADQVRQPSTTSRIATGQAPKIAPPDGSLHQVLAVVDGDTVKIETAAGLIPVRIIGIDTPETVHPSRPVEPFGPEASSRAKELLEGKTVTIQYDTNPSHETWGKYGRLLVYLKLPDGRDYGMVVVREGLARAYTKYPFSRSAEYVRAEQEAREAGRGLWAKESDDCGVLPKI